MRYNRETDVSYSATPFQKGSLTTATTIAVWNSATEREFNVESEDDITRYIRLPGRYR